MNIVVTGASGFYGITLVNTLVERGFSVTTIGRSGQVAPALAHLPIQHIQVDIGDRDGLVRALTGQKYLIHLAGLVSYRACDYDKLYTANVLGTRNVMAAARQAQIGRVVHVGSIAGMGIPAHGTVGTEALEYNLRGLGLYYCDTKYEGELEVHTACRQGLPAVILNPGITFGEGDTHPHHHTIFRSISKGLSLGYPTGGVTFSDIKDVVATCINALTAGRPGERYVVGSANLTFRQASEIVGRVINCRPPFMPIPGWLAETAGVLCEATFPLVGKVPSLTRQVAWLSQREIFFSSDKAIAELGLIQTPFEETIKRTASYYLGFSDGDAGESGRARQTNTGQSGGQDPTTKSDKSNALV